MGAKLISAIVLALFVLSFGCFISCDNGDSEMTKFTPSNDTSVNNNTNGETTSGENNIILCIDGVWIDSKTTSVYNDLFARAQLSFVDVLVNCGFVVNWMSDTTATITNDSVEFSLDIEAMTIVGINCSLDLLSMQSELDKPIEKTDKDLLIGQFTLEAVMAQLDVPIFIRAFNDDYNQVHVLSQITNETEDVLLVSDGEVKVLKGAYIDKNGQLVVPLIKTLEGVGCQTTRKNENEFDIDLFGEVYTFSLSNLTQVKYGSEVVEIDSPPGNDFKETWEVKEGEIMCDISIFRTYLDFMGQSYYALEGDDLTLYVFFARNP